MKTLKLVSMKTTGRDEPVTSQELMGVALSAYEEGLKGLDNITLTLKISSKIKAAVDTLELEDTEFVFLYKALDNCQWTGGVVELIEFFDELAKVK